MLNLDSRTRSKLVWTATLLAPVLVVQGVRTLSSASAAPASASAATSPAAPQAAQPTAAAAEPERPLTGTQLKARTWLLSRARTLQTRSPMDRPDPTPIEVALPDAHPAAPAPVESAIKPDGPPTHLLLTGMIAGGTESQALASINHRVYRVGDSVATNWKISAIDTRKRIVTLAGPDGQSMDLTPVPPAGER